MSLAYQIYVWDKDPETAEWMVGEADTEESAVAIATATYTALCKWKSVSDNLVVHQGRIAKRLTWGVTVEQNHETVAWIGDPEPDYDRDKD